MSDDVPRGPSLLRELADGSAGPVVRLVVTLALGAFLAGLTLLVGYLLAAHYPEWNRGNRGGYVSPDDGMMAWLFVASGVVYLVLIVWLWRRHARQHSLWFAVIATLVLFVVTVALCALADEMLVGNEEIVMSGIVLIAFGLAFILWLQCVRFHTRSRPVRNPADGRLDLRCPACSYRMVGLRESRCPECGADYTLDELLSRQNFPGLKPPADGPTPKSH